MALSAGSRLGPYEILSKLGAGGMGEVYKARDTRLGRSVAIKILPPAKLSDVDRQRRFEQEAIAASALNHPNIVTVYDVGTQDGMAFLAMELVSGKSLDQLISPVGMRINEILRIAAQIADAFTAAHAGGIVHRDLKPANVMVTSEGLVKILDFGLAKLSRRPDGDSEDQVTQTIFGHTDAGTVLGTAPYMSPEQAEGKPLDGRSDIFAFGSLLYEMATGRRAFRGDTALATMASILRDEPPASEQVREDLPPQLSRVIARCMRKDPARRFQHMADLKVELEDLKEESSSIKLSSSAPKLVPAARPVSRLKWVVSASVMLLAAVAAFLFLLNRPRAVVPAPVAVAQSSTTPVKPVESVAIDEPAAPAKAMPSSAPATPPPAPKAATIVEPTAEARVPTGARAAYEEAILLMGQEKLAEAVPHFDDAIRANPDYLNAHLSRAEAFRRLNQSEMSIADCNQALRIAPQDPRPYFCRGLGEALLRQYDLAVRDYGDAIRLNPDFAAAYDSRGNAYNNLQQFDGALDDFTQAIRLRPNNAQFYLRRAVVYEKLAQYAKAIQDYDEAIRIQPGNARGYNGRANAKKMSGDGRGAAADRRYAKQLKDQ